MKIQIGHYELDISWSRPCLRYGSISLLDFCWCFEDCSWWMDFTILNLNIMFTRFDKETEDYY